MNTKALLELIERVRAHVASEFPTAEIRNLSINQHDHSDGSSVDLGFTIVILKPKQQQ